MAKKRSKGEATVNVPKKVRWSGRTCGNDDGRCDFCLREVHDTFGRFCCHLSLDAEGRPTQLDRTVDGQRCLRTPDCLKQFGVSRGLNASEGESG